MNQTEMEIICSLTQKQKGTYPDTAIAGLESKVLESDTSFTARRISFAPIAL